MALKDTCTETCFIHDNTGKIRPYNLDQVASELWGQFTMNIIFKFFKNFFFPIVNNGAFLISNT